MIVAVAKQPGFATSFAPGTRSRNNSGNPYTASSSHAGAGWSNPYHAGYAAAGSRKSPARSITGTPTSTIAGARPALVPLGRAENTRSAALAIAPGSISAITRSASGRPAR